MRCSPVTLAVKAGRPTMDDSSHINKIDEFRGGQKAIVCDGRSVIESKLDAWKAESWGVNKLDRVIF